MLQSSSTHLALDLIATRDIMPGEELFLDYGEAWERAWEQHVRDWKPYHNAASYRSAWEFNQEHSDDWLRTSEEQQTNPYPDNLAIRCHSSLLESKRHEWNQQELWDWDESGEMGIPCGVRHRNDPNNTYTVELVLSSDDSYWSSIETLKHVPRRWIHFFEQPYSTDLHLPTAFRQPMGIPEELMPEVWKNINKQ
jgi:hypothetical protein